MSEFPEDLTDKLFQEGAKQFDFTYNPEAWGQMEAMLEVERKRRRLPIALLFTAVGLILTAGLYFFIGMDTSGEAYNVSNDTAGLIRIDENEIEKSSISHDYKVDDAVGFEGKFKPVKSTFLEDIVEQGGDEIKESTQEVIRDVEFVDEVDIHKSGGLISPLMNIENAAVPTQALNTIQIELNNEAYSVNTPLSAKPSGSKSSIELVEESLSNEEDQFNVSLLSARNLEKVNVVSPTEQAVLMIRAPSPSTSESTTNELLSRISVRAFVGNVYGVTDQSGVGMARSRYGLGIGYSVNENWALSSGVNINNLCYITNGEGYRTKQNNWFGGVSPSRIEALCKVLEIPLEATYYWDGNKSSGFYLRGGILNYIMLKENYSYNYNQDEVPPNIQVSSLRRQWSEVNENRHFLGMAQVSLGYQLGLTKSSQVQLEAFVHAPMTGVGHGEVRVWSFGANAAFNLHLK